MRCPQTGLPSTRPRSSPRATVLAPEANCSAEGRAGEEGPGTEAGGKTWGNLVAASS